MKTDILFLLSFWICWYGIIALIGWFAEKRVLPMGRLQSKAFFPGDMALPVAILALYKQVIRADKLPNFYYTIWFTIIVIVCMFTLMFFVARRDQGFYPERAAWSPTRLWHVAWGFFLIPTGIVRFALPIVIEACRGNVKIKPLHGIHFAAAIAFYIAMVAYDAYVGSKVTIRTMRRFVYARHPYNWGSGNDFLEDREFGIDGAADPETGELYLYGPEGEEEVIVRRRTRTSP